MTFADVQAAMEQLRAWGERSSVRRVRKLLGRGSLTDMLRFMKTQGDTPPIPAAHNTLKTPKIAPRENLRKPKLPTPPPGTIIYHMHTGTLSVVGPDGVVSPARFQPGTVRGLLDLADLYLLRLEDRGPRMSPQARAHIQRHLG